MAGAQPTPEKLRELEARIGHRFSSHDRLERALTHASASARSENKNDYERLEFLGDRVLGLCIANMLFTAFPKAREGELSRRINALVSGDTCTEVADEIGLAEFIRAGNDVKQLSSKRMKGVRADVVEALIASIYLDSGLEGAHAFIKRFWGERLHQKGAADRDSKTALQEWAHAMGYKTPVYEIEERIGPDHDPVFKVRVVVAGTVGEIGAGRSKRAAEQTAAEAVLRREGVWTEDDAPADGA